MNLKKKLSLEMHAYGIHSLLSLDMLVCVVVGSVTFSGIRAKVWVLGTYELQNGRNKNQDGNHLMI